MSDLLQQSVTNALPNHAGTALTLTSLSWISTVLGILTPIVGFIATVSGLLWMRKIHKKKLELLDSQIAENKEHRERENATD